jgi:hypothetical protein
VLLLKSKDINYVSVSPKILGQYQVVIELFGPSKLELARMTGSNIGNEIDVYISDTFIGRYPITAKVDSGFIVVGQYDNIDNAVSRVTEILTALNNSE